MRIQVRSLALLSELKIQCCYDVGFCVCVCVVYVLPWCRSQTQLGSHVAVAVAQAGGYSSDSTPNLGTSIHCGSSARNGKKKKKKNYQKVTWRQKVSKCSL